MNERSIEITQSHIDLLLPVIEKATQYEEIIDHKRKLGITGEIGEVKACFRYGLKLVLDSQSAGYDAIDAEGLRVQIKTRRSELGKKLTNPTRLSSFSKHEFDYCLLLLLDNNYDIYEVWRANSVALEPIIKKHIRRNPPLGSFKQVATKIYDKKSDQYRNA